MGELILPPKVLYALASVYALSIGSQLWSNYRVAQIESRITEQLEGKLDEQARVLQTVQKDIGLAQAKMIDLDELERRTDKALSKLSKETQDKIDKYQRDTQAQMTSLSVRVRRVNAHLTKGFAEVGQKVDSKTPPPPKWKGVKKEEVSWCKDDPSKCDPFPISWSYPTRDNPVASFSSQNIWGDQFELKLDLGFRVTTVGFRDKEGVVENQAVFFDVGFTNEETGEFQVLQHFEVKEGDGKETDVFFHTTSIDPDIFKNNLDTFEFSLLLGASFAPQLTSGSSLSFRTGMSIGGGIVNFRKGEIRIGANVVGSTEILGLGLFTSYHPKLFGKNFNIAPMFGVLYDSTLNPSLQVGLSYQLY